jgi:hypothetical protein
VMTEQEPEVNRHIDRLDLASQPGHREAVNAGEEAAVAPFGGVESRGWRVESGQVRR